MAPPTLLAVPNVSEGRDAAVVARIAAALTRNATETEVRLLDTHSDADHHRSVYTLAGRQTGLSEALTYGAAAAIDAIDLSIRDVADPDAGRHPHVGAIDVVPLVYLTSDDRGAACAEALTTAERLAHELELPVFLYGELTGPEPRTRAELRRGGLSALAARMAAGELRPDFGPSTPHPTAGATLLAARPPLVAFNLVLQAPATTGDAQVIAAQIREHGSHGIRGLRAIGVELGGARAQVSMNVEDPLRTPLAEIVRAVQARAGVESAELVGLAPKAAFEGFPPEIPIPGFDPDRHLIENALRSP